jgi:hypothetical protein
VHSLATHFLLRAARQKTNCVLAYPVPMKRQQQIVPKLRKKKGSQEIGCEPLNL